MHKADKQKFKLKDMKSTDRASVDFNSTLLVSDGAASNEIPYKGPYPIIPHPDLLAELDKLKIRLASFYGYTLFEAFVNESNFDATKAQKKYAEQFTSEMMEKIKVTGMAFSGKERNGIIVKGTFSGNSINTKTLYFTNQEYGEELREIADKIEDEMFEYIFRDKKAALELAFGDE